MPELPEVETVRRSLLPLVIGKKIEQVSVGAFAGVLGGMDPASFAALTTGSTIADIRRRGKYLLFDLADGAGFIVHLRMTGNLTHARSGAEPVRFEHLSIHLDDGSSIRFADQRKFGRIEYRPKLGRRPLDGKLGPEPLTRSFNAAYLAERVRNRTAPIKALILDQRIIAGVGNIYADEALFRSRIHPTTPGGALSGTQVASLVRAIKSVLRSAIEHRGTTFASYRDANGETGTNQFRLRIYGRGRSGKPCLRCGRQLATLTVGGRTSHFCPHCQPAPESADAATRP